jgi:hypothetical protein
MEKQADDERVAGFPTEDNHEHQTGLDSFDLTFRDHPQTQALVYDPTTSSGMQ